MDKQKILDLLDGLMSESRWVGTYYQSGEKQLEEQAREATDEVLDELLVALEIKERL